MSAPASMLGWEDGICERLAAGSRLVIRYDRRDTGRSVSYEPGAPRYTFRDLVADAVGLLDVFGAARAHLVGMLVGGSVGQSVALAYPERVAPLPLMADGDQPRGDKTGRCRPAGTVRGVFGLRRGLRAAAVVASL
jgi:pimeloyl-ACP methyl ester carboxylesterase